MYASEPTSLKAEGAAGTSIRDETGCNALSRSSKRRQILLGDVKVLTTSGRWAVGGCKRTCQHTSCSSPTGSENRTLPVIAVGSVLPAVGAVIAVIAIILCITIAVTVPSTISR